MEFNKSLVLSFVLFFSFHLYHISAVVLDDWYGKGVSKISRQLPNLNYSLEAGLWAKLKDGKASKKSHLSPLLTSATLESNPIIFVDLNMDGFVDALVIIRVTYTGIGYFDLFAVPVLMHPFGKAYIPQNSGFRIGQTSIYSLASFDLVGDHNLLRIAFMDRKPGEPKVIAPSVPTILTLEYNVHKRSLIKYSKRIVKKCYYYAIFGRA